jgi:CRP-like cAMP-binding protein
LESARRITIRTAAHNIPPDRELLNRSEPRSAVTFRSGDCAIESGREPGRPTTGDSDLFRGLPREEIEALDGASAVERVARFRTLFQDGQTLAHLYVVSIGSFKLVRHSEEGREFIVYLAGRGDLLGALAEPAVAEAAARALEDSTLLAVPVAAVRRALERNPSFALRVVRETERRLRVAEIRAARFAYESVPRRLAALLLEATDRRSGLLRYPLNQSELASFIGSSRETVCSVLNQLRREAVVETSRGRIRVLDRKRLAAES